MVSYLILCRSLTYAQRYARILERSGIIVYIMRTPRSISQDGCGYCIRVREKLLTGALKALRRQGIDPGPIYMKQGENVPEEVQL